MSKNNLEELMQKLIYQTTPKYMEEVGEVVRNGILERIPRYYEGGAVGLLNRVIRRFGGHFNVSFRLGHAGFSHDFYLSYDYYNSEYDVIKLRDEQISEEYLVTQSDIECIIERFHTLVELYLDGHDLSKTFCGFAIKR